MKAENVKIGQRVRVRWVTQVTGDSVERDCTVVGVSGFAVKVDAINGWFHCSQLRLLKPKKKQPWAMDGRRWWVNVYSDGPLMVPYETREVADRRAAPSRVWVAELAIVARHPVGKGE